MNKFYLFFIVLFWGVSLSAQTSFQKYFAQPAMGGILYRVIQTSDGGYAAIGKLTDNASFNDDFLVMKADATGNAIWIRKIATSDSEEFTDILETSGDGLIVAGTKINLSSFTSEAVVEKFDAAGTKQWCKTYTVSGFSTTASKLQKDDAGNLFVLGTSDAGGTSDYYILKLDASGAILQRATFATPDNDFPLSFLRHSNGDMYIGGWENSLAGENIHIIKVSPSMTVDWSKLISGPVKYFAYDMREKSNGHLVLAGRYDDGSTSYDVLLLEVDDGSGEISWAKSYSGGDGLPAYAYGLAINSGDAIAITGSLEDTTGGTLIMGMDPDGVVSWSERVGAQSGDYGIGYGIGKCSDGGYIIVGPRGGSNNSIFQLLKTPSNGSLLCNSSAYAFVTTVQSLPSQDRAISTGTPAITATDASFPETSFSSLSDICPSSAINEPAVQQELSVYPNPTDGKITVSFRDRKIDVSVRVVNVLGEEIYSRTFPSGSGDDKRNIRLDLPKHTGICFLQFNDGGATVTQKLVIR